MCAAALARLLSQLARWGVEFRVAAAPAATPPLRPCARRRGGGRRANWRRYWGTFGQPTGCQSVPLHSSRTATGTKYRQDISLHMRSPTMHKGTACAINILPSFRSEASSTTAVPGPNWMTSWPCLQSSSDEAGACGAGGEGGRRWAPGGTDGHRGTSCMPRVPCRAVHATRAMVCRVARSACHACRAVSYCMPCTTARHATQHGMQYGMPRT